MDPERTHTAFLYKNKVTGSTADNYTGMLVVSLFVRKKEIWYGMVCSCMYYICEGRLLDWYRIARRYMCVCVCMDGGDLDGSLR